jgi:hypothetical protein
VGKLVCVTVGAIEPTPQLHDIQNSRYGLRSADGTAVTTYVIISYFYNGSGSGRSSARAVLRIVTTCSNSTTTSLTCPFAW